MSIRGPSSKPRVQPKPQQPPPDPKLADAQKKKAEAANKTGAVAGSAGGVVAGAGVTTPTTPQQKETRGASTSVRGELTQDASRVQNGVTDKLNPTATMAPDMRALLANSTTATTTDNPNAAAEQQLRDKLKENPENGVNEVKKHLDSLPDDESRAKALESLKPDLANAIARHARENDGGTLDLLMKVNDAIPQGSRASFLQSNHEAIKTIGQKLGNADSRTVKVQLEALGYLAEKSGPEGKNAIARSLAEGLPADALKDPNSTLMTATRELMNTTPENARVGPLLTSTAAELRNVDPAAAAGLDSITGDVATRRLSNAKTKYEELKAEDEAIKKRLGAELKRVGPGLTAEEKKKFIDEFKRRDGNDVSEKLKAATDELKDSLKDLSSQPRLNAEQTRLALDSAKELAQTPSGAEAAKNFAVEMTRRLEQDPQALTMPSGAPLILNPNLPPDEMQRRIDAANPLKALHQELGDIATKAVPNMMAKAVEEGGPDGAAERFANMTQGMENLKALTGGIEPINKAIEALKAGKFQDLAEIGNTPLGSAFKAAGAVLAFVKLSQGANPSAAEFLKDSMSMTKDGADFVKDAIIALSKEGAENSTALKLGKFTPGVGVVASALSLALNVRKWAGKEGNLGDGISALGDAFTMAGSVLAATGVGIPVGAVLDVAGALVSAAGNLTSAMINDERHRAETADILDKIGMGEVGQNLANTKPQELERLANETQMSPEAIQKLYRDHPEIAGNSTRFWQFVNVASASRLKGDDVLKLADALKQDGVGLGYFDNDPGNIRRSLFSQSPTARKLMQERGITPVY